MRAGARRHDAPAGHRQDEQNPAFVGDIGCDDFGTVQPRIDLRSQLFRFLLDREPKEAILARFDISVIGRYFPEFGAELPAYLGAQG